MSRETGFSHGGLQISYMDNRTVYENTLCCLLTDLLQEHRGKKKIILGCRRISAVYCCALRTLGSDVDYFIDPEHTDSGERTFFGRPVYGPQELLYEDMERIIVINSLHYAEITEPIVEAFGLERGKNYTDLRGYQKAEKSNLFDPLLGDARRENCGLFHKSGEEKEGALRIVTVGGAATDHTYSGFISWPEYLHELLTEAGIDNVVYNGGLNGYTSCEERDLVLRDGLALAPDCILSLSGECDIGYLMVSKSHPWYSACTEGRLKGMQKRAQVRPYQRFWFDTPTDSRTPDYQNWVRNERIMHAAAESAGIRFYGFLQPFIFEGGYVLSDFEKSWMELFLSEGPRELPTIQKIYRSSHPFYEAARRCIRDIDYLTDLSGAFDSVSGVYSDGVHYDEAGNRILAQAIYSHVFDKKE